MTLHLPDQRSQHWTDALPGLLDQDPETAVELDFGDWHLNCSDLRHLVLLLNGQGRQLRWLRSRHPQTVVSANAMGLGVRLEAAAEPKQSRVQGQDGLFIHRGTLRSGDHLHGDGDVLIYGDVNPGAHVSAGGDVMVWGRLRGTAHAGITGSYGAKIVALHLRPVQLRIADVVARGPDDQPLDGQTEQARIDEGVIVIEPATTRNNR